MGSDNNGTGPRQASNPPVVDSYSSTQAGDAGARCPELSPVEQAITGQPTKAELQRIYLEVANGYVGRPR